MIVCLCRRVSDRAIVAALDAGATSAEEVALATGAGTSCGCCRPSIEVMVQAHAVACSAEPCAACPRRRPAAAALQEAA